MDFSLVLWSFSSSSSSVKSMPFQSLCTFYPSLHETLFCQILIDARSYLLSSRSLYTNGTKRDIKCEKHHKTKINSEEIVMQGVLRGKAWLWAEGSRKPGIWAEFWWMVMFPTGQPFSIFFFLIDLWESDETGKKKKEAEKVESCGKTSSKLKVKVLDCSHHIRVTWTSHFSRCVLIILSVKYHWRRYDCIITWVSTCFKII